MRNYASLYSSLLIDLEISDFSDGHIFSDMTNVEAAKLALAGSFYKKLCPKGNSRKADSAALEKFLSINSAISCDPFVFEAESEAESCFYDYFKHHLNTCLGPHEGIESFSLDSIRSYMNVGPGAAQKADASTIVTKLFEGAMSYTNDDLIRYYRAALTETGFWADAEMRRFQKFGFVKVRGNKLFFAPKNADISRVCGTEANLNMLIQKSIEGFMLFRLAWYFGINLSIQPDYNRELARKGSIDGTIGTIDLVSASDHITVSLVRDAMDNTPLKTFMFMSRSEESVLPDGKSVKLNMMSTMGNGFTFPFQTIIFASAVRAVYQLMGLPSDCPRTQFGVFGDDICVHKDAYEFLSKMLTKLGFKVNDSKSFNSGSFRESCGLDYVSGYNIRGVYIKSLETQQQVYTAINRLARWSARHGVPLTRTIKTLLSWVRDIRIPLVESDDAGIQVPFKLTRPKLTDSYWFQYRAYCKRRRVLQLFEPDEEDVDKAPFNPEGVAIGFLSGHYRRRDISLTTDNDSAWKHDWSFSATLRDRIGERSRYQIVSKSLPYWDYLPTTKLVDDPEDGGERRIPLTRDSHHRWEAVMVALLTIGE